MQKKELLILAVHDAADYPVACIELDATLSDVRQVKMKHNALIAPSSALHDAVSKWLESHQITPHTSDFETNP